MCNVPESADLGNRLCGERAATPNQCHLLSTGCDLFEEGLLGSVSVALCRERNGQ